MADKYFLQRTDSQQKQVDTWTITGVGAGASVWTFTLTLDDGTTETVTYTNTGSPTTALIVAGLEAAWNALTAPANIARATAAATDPAIAITSDTAGRPMSIALANDGGGTATKASTTANAGNNVGNAARNWNGAAIPVNSDNVIFEPGNVGLLYGLDFSAIQIADLQVKRGYQGDIGRFEDGRLFYWPIDPDTFEYRGNGSLAAFNFQTSISPYIESYGSPQVQGRHAVYLNGDMSDVEITKGNVGIGVRESETPTVGNIIVGYMSQQLTDVNLSIGSGVVLTNLTLGGGRTDMRCAASGTVKITGGAELVTSGTGTIARVDAYGAAFLSGSGTITDLYAFGAVDFRRDRSARTITNLRLEPGAEVWLHSNITVTNIIGPTLFSNDKSIQLYNVL